VKTKIIAVANQKGGVGKTTTVINLAAWLADKARMKVLVVDFDVQGHAATCLGRPKGDGLFRWLVTEEPITQAVVGARPGIDLVTSNKLTERIRHFLADMVARELYIGEMLNQAAGRYDVVLLDLAPGSDLLHVGALAASDLMLTPAKMDFLALDGVTEIIKTARSLGRIPQVTPPALIGVLPTMYDRATTETSENIRRLGDAVGVEQILPPVPQDTRVREAAARGLTIWEYAPDTPAALGYVMDGQAGRNSLGRLGGYWHLAEIVCEWLR